MALLKKVLIIKEKSTFGSYTSINGVFRASNYKFKRLYRDLSPPEAMCPCIDCSMTCTGNVRRICIVFNSMRRNHINHYGYRFSNVV